MKYQELATPVRTAARSGQWLVLLLGLMLLSLLALPVRAADDIDPPDRAGRLSEVNGQVWIYDTEANEWIQALRNRPLTTGDRLSTEADGRAEVRMGSTVLHLAANSEIEVSRLDDNQFSLRLHSGTLSARFRTRESADEFSLTTEEGSFRTLQAGQYRFDRTDNNTAATALSGQAVFETDGTALSVQQGQRVEFWKERGVPQYAITNPARDAFGDWVASRDSRDERSVSTRYVSAEMTGAEDLDRYGRWEQSADYGPLWIPRTVAPGWAPYRMGHWAWVRPWGWTWVDDAPWGFAPFHYGRWVWHRDNWCWTPGRYAARPVYAPALVAWVGGPQVSVSVSVGNTPNVGWFPLGPREVYVPSYRVSPRYVRSVNVTHVTQITNVDVIINNPAQFMAGARYMNRGLPRAVTVVPSSVVVRRQPVGPAYRRGDDRVLRDFARERPRAEAPVAAPPRWMPGSRQVADPRVSRPGFSPVEPSRDAGNGRPPRSDDRDRRERERPVSPEPVRPAVPASPERTEPSRDLPRWMQRDEDRVRSRPPAEAPHVQPPPSRDGSRGNPPPGFTSPRPTVPAPERNAPPPPDERKRHHEMPGPPRVDVQAPQPRAPSFQPVAPVVRAPVVVQPPPPQAAPRERQTQPEGRQRARDEREGANERRERGDRADRIERR